MLNRPKTVKYFLKQLKTATNKDIAICLLDIKILEQTSPDAVVGQRKLTENSSQDILAKELLPSLQTKLIGLQAKIKMINELL